MKHPKVNSGEITFVIKEQISNTAEGNRDQNEYTNLTPHIPEYVGFVWLQSRELRDIAKKTSGEMYLSILTMIPMEKSESLI